MARWNRASTADATTITYNLWLAIDADGGARMTRTEPSLNAGERSMKLALKVPRSNFRIPTLSGVIVIEDDPGIRDELIAAVEHNAANLLREHMQVDFRLTVEPPADDAEPPPHEHRSPSRRIS